MRGRGVSPISNSDGGTASTINCTIPSPGETISPSRVGIVRSGSRKKYMTHKVTTAPMAASGPQIQPSTKVTTTAAATNGTPALWIGAATDFHISLMRLEAAVKLVSRY